MAYSTIPARTEGDPQERSFAAFKGFLDWALMGCSPPHRLGVCAIFRNEADYLAEWILFHRAQGVTRFILFDDGSTDDFVSVLEPFVKEGLVAVHPANGSQHWTSRQLSTYQTGLVLARNDCEWLAFIDIDEFLFSPQGAISRRLPRRPWVAGVFVWWRIFGSSGRKAPPSAGVLRSYTRAAPWPVTLAETKELRALSERGFFSDRSSRPISGRLVQGKSVVRPKLILEMGVHFPKKYRGVVVDEQGKTVFREWSRFMINGFPSILTSKSGFRLRTPTVRNLRINHYWSRSLSDLEQKALKFASVRRAATLEDYLRWDQEVLNAELDETVLQAKLD